MTASGVGFSDNVHVVSRVGDLSLRFEVGERFDFRLTRKHFVEKIAEGLQLVRVVRQPELVLAETSHKKCHLSSYIVHHRNSPGRRPLYNIVTVPRSC